MFDWLIEFVGDSGYLGILFLMLAENIFPPLPSELIMPLAGFTAARGELSMVGVIVAGTVGSLLGALLWYYVGCWIGLGRLKRWAVEHGRWFTVAPEDIDQAAAWFNRHCGQALVVGRLIPAIRTLISVPAGVAGMSLPKFLGYSALGTVLWTGLLAGAGYLLEGQYQKVGEYLNPVSNVIMGLLLLGYLYRVVTFSPRKVS